MAKKHNVLKKCYYCDSFPAIDVKSNCDSEGVRLGEEDLFKIECCKFKAEVYTPKSDAIGEWNKHVDTP